MSQWLSSSCSKYGVDLKYILNLKDILILEQFIERNDYLYIKQYHMEALFSNYSKKNIFEFLKSQTIQRISENNSNWKDYSLGFMIKNGSKKIFNILIDKTYFHPKVEIFLAEYCVRTNNKNYIVSYMKKHGFGSKKAQKIVSAIL